tara:strand:- start:269 stop:706 length:438 start_codon:yes stop_codon:yes gene_type:complete
VIKHFHVGVKGVIRHPADGRVLLMHMHSGHWDLPGGRTDEGELEFETTLLRELSEELPGISNVQIGRQFGAVRMPRDLPAKALEPGVDASALPGGGIGVILVLFDVTATLPDPVRVSDEHASCSWETRERAAEVFPHAAHFFLSP